jgi:hypothetical protein
MPSLNTGNAILSNAIAVDSSYNVGIGGAASGGFKLNVTGTSNFTGALTASAGSLIPSIIAIGSGNGNGIIQLSNSSNYTIGAGTDYGGMEVRVGGSQRILILNNGNVGINQSNPTFLLDVNGTARVVGAATFSSSVTAVQGIFRNSGVPAIQAFRDLDVTIVGSAGQNIEFGARSGSTFIAGALIGGGLDNPATTGSLVFQTLNAGTLGTRLTISNTGAATFSSSITSSSGDIFSTDGTRTNYFGVSTGANIGIIGMTSNHNLSFITNNTERMRITSGGQVGIATTGTTGDGMLQVNSFAGTFGDSSKRRGMSVYSTAAENADQPGVVLGYDTAGAGIIAARTNSSGQPLAFWTYNGSAWGERMRITSGGELQISNSILRVNASSTTSVSTSATTISTGSNTYGGIAIVWGADVSGNVWTDLLFYSLGQVFVIRGQDVSGGPAGRTYSVNGSGALRLAMASGTYTVRYQALLTA